MALSAMPPSIAAVAAFVAALFTELLHFLLSLTPLSRFLVRPDHFAPHPNAPFEGYYTRIVTSTGATILLILSSVRNAPDKPHYVHFSHIPPGAAPDLRIDVFPTALHDVPGPRRHSGIQEFTLVASDDLGRCHTTEHEQTYSLRLPDPDGEGIVEVDVALTRRAPWDAGNPLSTPEGAFASLTRLLPLHWHVFSHRSTARFRVRRNNADWLSGEGVAHVEKNWGVSFPRGWTWIQAFSAHATFSLAGGRILGQQAFLLGYRSPLHKYSFAPPTTLLPFATAVSPFLGVRRSSRDGTLSLTAHSLLRTTKLVIDASGPPDHARWIPLACPLAGGHARAHAYETFEARLCVSVWQRDWAWGDWVLCERTRFQGAALEFGGSYSHLVAAEAAAAAKRR